MLASNYAENTTSAGKIKRKQKSLLIIEEKVNKALSKSETRGQGRRNHGQANVQCLHCTKDMLLLGLTEEEGVDLCNAINVKDLLLPPNHLELEGERAWAIVV